MSELATLGGREGKERERPSVELNGGKVVLVWSSAQLLETRPSNDPTVDVTRVGA